MTHCRTISCRVLLVATVEFLCAAPYLCQSWVKLDKFCRCLFTAADSFLPIAFFVAGSELWSCPCSSACSCAILFRFSGAVPSYFSYVLLLLLLFILSLVVSFYFFPIAFPLLWRFDVLLPKYYGRQSRMNIEVEERERKERRSEL